ncbi:MAG: hypothetical protein WBQ93_04075 [Candidatus Competibacter sp.]
MRAKRILLLVGDCYVEDYEVMVPFQALRSPRRRGQRILLG